jgi:hypothetical protein
MGIAAEVFEDLLRAGERAFGISDPLFGKELFE